MKQRKKTTVILKAPAHEKMVAELWCGENVLGEMVREKNDFYLELYAPPGTQKSWNLELNDFLYLLGEAKKELNSQAKTS
jgi:predicted secreted protein